MGNFVSSQIYVIKDAKQAKFFLLAGFVPALMAVISGYISKEINNITTLSTWIALLVWMRSIYHWKGYEIGMKTILFVFLITAAAGFLSSNSMLMFIGFGGLGFMFTNWVWNRHEEQEFMLARTDVIPMAREIRVN